MHVLIRESEQGQKEFLSCFVCEIDAPHVFIKAHVKKKKLYI
jgi:hypothetical protein